MRGGLGGTQVIESQELTPIGPLRGRRDVSFTATLLDEWRSEVAATAIHPVLVGILPAGVEIPILWIILALVKGGPVSCIITIGNVLVVVRERKLGGFREGGIALLDGNFTGKVGGGGGGEVVGHARKVARYSDNATKKMFFFDVFFLDFSQLIEREELTPIGPRRGRGDVSF